jgi:ribosomal protein L11 methyltransferase
MEPRYPFVAVDVPAELADDIGAALFELGATGIEERDEGTLARGPGSGRVTLVGSFDDREAADHAIEALAALDLGLAPRLEEVVGDAWRDAWKEHFAPFALTPSITVAPPWAAPPEPLPGARVLVLEPGRAFGTGLHATTALVAELLHARAAALASTDVLDVGTGSGILALVALLYGARHATAIDIDPDVVDVVRENAERNGLADRVTARQGAVQSVARAFPVVLANIEARVLGPIAEDLAAAVAPGGTLVLSGILAPEHDAIVARYTGLSRGLRHEATASRGEGETGWVAIAFSAA